MKNTILLIFSFLFMIFFTNCKQDQPNNDFELYKDFSIKVNKALNNYDEDITIKFDSIATDSRCPIDANCIWEGEASAKFTLTNNGIKKSFTLSTHPDYTTDTIISNYCIKLIELLPYPDSNTTISERDYSAKMIISDSTCNCTTDEINVTADFYYEYTINTGAVQFVNYSENASNYIWDFGDGTSSTEAEPIHNFDIDKFYTVSLIAINGIYRDTIIQQVYPYPIAMKPNIYIYPTATIDLCVNISFPNGGSVTTSIPDYNSGWCVKVQASGLIDNQYTYLFYESAQPNKNQYQKGWCVAKADLKTFFESNMNAYNFSHQEITDFTEYWIPKLMDSEFYLIYPQTNENIDPYIQLNFSIQPNQINRLFYSIAKADSPTFIEKPIIEAFNRNGYTVMEWGVFLN